MDEDEADFEQAIAEDDLRFRADEFGKLSPYDYAKLRNMRPQRVYYFIRSKQLEFEWCNCGRRIIDVRAADEFFAAKDKGPDSATPNR